MDLFIDSKVRTRSRIRRGVSPQPDTKGKRPHFNSGANWKIASHRDEGLSELEVEIGRHIPLEVDKVEPLCILPSQKERHIELSPEQTMLERLLFETLEDLRYSFRPKKEYKGMLRKVERKEILDWINGAEAAFTFEQCLSELKMNEVLIHNVIAEACKSWEKTNGEFPRLGLRNNNLFELSQAGYIEEKPPPILTKRFKLSLTQPVSKPIIGLSAEANAYLKGVRTTPKFKCVHGLLRSKCPPCKRDFQRQHSFRYRRSPTRMACIHDIKPMNKCTICKVALQRKANLLKQDRIAIRRKGTVLIPFESIQEEMEILV